MIDFVTFKWKPPFQYRSTFTGEHVNVLRDMIARNYKGKHRLTCVTDDPTGIDADVRVLPLWDDFADVQSPHGAGNPSCYRRLKLWSEEAADLIGERICSIDLDVVIAADITHIVERPEDFVLWGDYVNPQTHYNGSMQLIRAGCRPDIYRDFDPKNTPLQTRGAGFHGSDQAWLSLKFGPDAPRWTIGDGVASFRIHCSGHLGRRLPNCAKVIFFHGKHDPWDADVQAKYAWVKDHWRLGK